jgi:hypothetical protein
MRLRLNSWHALFYKANYRGLPMSLCTYFWKLVLAILLIPFTFIGLLVAPIREEKSTVLNVCTTTILYLSVLAGYVIGNDLIEITDPTMLQYLLLSLLGVGAMILAGIAVSLIVGIPALLIYFIQKKVENEKYDSEKKYVVIEWWRGFKGKYCPRINWN